MKIVEKIAEEVCALLMPEGCRAAVRKRGGDGVWGRLVS